jgi:hypothetical protein
MSVFSEDERAMVLPPLDMHALLLAAGQALEFFVETSFNNFRMHATTLSFGAPRFIPHIDSSWT